MTNQDNDLQDNDPSPQQQQSQDQNFTQFLQSHEKEEEEEEDDENPHLHEQNHPISVTMISSSSPPPNPHSPLPSDSPSQSTHSVDHTSSGYVFSAPEVKQSTYQSPPSDYIHTSHSYVLSSPDKSSSPPPAPSSAPPSVDGINGAGVNRRPRISISISERNREEVIKRKFLLGFRILGFLFCLISFSIMASDKNQGWALDSFYRYKEFRYCMSVNVIGFVYLGVQSCDLAYCLAAGKIIARNQLRFFLDFSLDQILTYLVLSASSSAAYRVEDWESNWGKDKFPAMARSSVVLSFLAFVAFTLSSLISGHTLFTSKFI